MKKGEDWFMNINLNRFVNTTDGGKDFGNQKNRSVTERMIQAACSTRNRDKTE